MIETPAHSSVVEQPSRPPIVTESNERRENERKSPVQVLQNAWNRFAKAYDNHELTPEDEANFGLFNMDYWNTNQGQQRTRETYDGKGKSRTIVRQVLLNPVLDFYDRLLTGTTSESTRREIEQEIATLRENSRPLMRTDVREELRQQMVERKAVELSRQYTGADSDAKKYVREAEELLRNGVEFFPKADVPELTVRTKEEALQNLDAAVEASKARLDEEKAAQEPAAPLDPPLPPDTARFLANSAEARSGHAQLLTMAGEKAAELRNTAGELEQWLKDEDARRKERQQVDQIVHERDRGVLETEYTGADATQSGEQKTESSQEERGSVTDNGTEVQDHPSEEGAMPPLEPFTSPSIYGGTDAEIASGTPSSVVLRQKETVPEVNPREYIDAHRNNTGREQSSYQPPAPQSKGFFRKLASVASRIFKAA